MRLLSIHAMIEQISKHHGYWEPGFSLLRKGVTNIERRKDRRTPGFVFVFEGSV